MKKQYLFEYISHYCQCGCNGIIQLNKKKINEYEYKGYPKFIRGHGSRLCHKKFSHGRFSFIPHYCGCSCGNLLNLNTKKIASYEMYGYPKFILGHYLGNDSFKDRIIYGNFEFIPHLCKCGCHETIKLKKKYFSAYERNGYPEFIQGHNVYKNCSTLLLGDFEYLPIFCKCPCHKQLILNKNKFYNYEKCGYPEFIQNHGRTLKTEGNNTVEWKKVLQRKQLGWYSLNPSVGNGREIVKGFERHHVNHYDIIYVPKDYNQDIKHNLRRNFNMEIVNTISYFFLIMNYIEDLNKIFKEDK